MRGTGSPVDITKVRARELFTEDDELVLVMAVGQFPITDVQTWMGHADIATTRKYIH